MPQPRAVKPKATPKAAPKPRAKTAVKPKAPTAAKAALAELEDGPREGNFRGVTLALPPQLSAAFALDLAEAEAGGGGVGGLYRVIVGMIGADGWRSVRDKVAEDGDSIDNLERVMQELVEAIVSTYGVTPGEPEASVAS